MKVLVKAIEGPDDSVRAKISKEKRRYLEVSEQVDCLIE